MLFKTTVQDGNILKLDTYELEVLWLVAAFFILRR
jgi:hypothetical protein